MTEGPNLAVNTVCTCKIINQSWLKPIIEYKTLDLKKWVERPSTVGFWRPEYGTHYFV